MAKQKIDFSKIEGYAAMSAEDKLKALEGYEYDIPEDMAPEAKKWKEQFDRVSSELAKKNKEEREKLSAEEQAKAEAAETIEELQKANAALTMKIQISEYTARYLALGYDESLAKSTAEAFAKGDTETVFKNAEAHNKAIEARIKKDLLAGTGKPDDKGGSANHKTREEILAIKDTEERQAEMAKNPSLFGIEV